MELSGPIIFKAHQVENNQQKSIVNEQLNCHVLFSGDLWPEQDLVTLSVAKVRGLHRGCQHGLPGACSQRTDRVVFRNAMDAGADPDDGDRYSAHMA